MTALDLTKKLSAKFGELVSEPTEFRGELTVNVADAARITEVCAFAKKELGFNLLLDVSSAGDSGGAAH